MSAFPSPVARIQIVRAARIADRPMVMPQVGSSAPSPK
jgi:hypothetical protein